MARSVVSWVGASDDAAIPPRVKVRIFDRDGGKCRQCTRLIGGSIRPAYDHVIALVNGGRNAEDNLQLLCEECHRVKTGEDVAEKASVYRKKAKDRGIKKPRSIRQWRKFNGEKVFAPRER